MATDAPDADTLRALLPADRDRITTARWTAEYRTLIPALFEAARTANEAALFHGLVAACDAVLAALHRGADPQERAWVQAERANALRRLAQYMATTKRCCRRRSPPSTRRWRRRRCRRCRWRMH